MARFARTIHIAAPPGEVWKVLADVERWPAWASQFRRLERHDPAPLGLGSRVRVKPKGMLAATWLVTEYEDGRSFTWASSLAPGLRVTGGHVLSANGAGTDAEFWLEAGGAAGPFLGPLLRSTVFSRNTRSATEGLKRYVEGQQPALE